MIELIPIFKLELLFYIVNLKLRMMDHFFKDINKP